MNKFLLIEGTDFAGFPGGGVTQQAMYVLRVFPDRVALVGISTDNTPVGRWIKKRFHDTEIDFFSVYYESKSFHKPLIPKRLKFFLYLRRYRRRIQSIGLDHMLTQSPEVILATRNWRWPHVCYWSAGVGHPLRRSRYPWARILSGAFHRYLYKALNKVDIILASADEQKIREFIERSRGKISPHQVVKFPTRIDVNYFKPVNKASELKQPKRTPTFIALGRLSKVKGWDLLLDSLCSYIDRYQDAELFFVGDGEDRKQILDKIDSLGLVGKVHLTGHQSRDEVLVRLQSADLVLFGSTHEGWSVAMVEAIACGKPIVSTKVSGSSEMIKDGLNGFIVQNRDPREFADKMHLALKLENASEISRSLAGRYSLESLKSDLERYWIGKQ
jgi:glycosyltransferase involved in cell wall biosynthesis